MANNHTNKTETAIYSKIDNPDNAIQRWTSRQEEAIKSTSRGSSEGSQLAEMDPAARGVGIFQTAGLVKAFPRQRQSQRLKVNGRQLLQETFGMVNG